MTQRPLAPHHAVPPARRLEMWPVFGIRVTTPRITLRAVDPDLAFAIADLSSQGIHDPATMPFATPWSDAGSPQLERNGLKHYWAGWGSWSADTWHLPFAVFEGDTLVGTQSVVTHDFPALRGFETGSWVSRAHQGRGIGKEMRAAVLHFAFAGLGALDAFTGAWEDNAASIAVTRALGYRDNGIMVGLRRTARDRQVLFTMDRAHWETIRRDDIAIAGLDDACLAMFGLAPDLTPLPPPPPDPPPPPPPPPPPEL